MVAAERERESEMDRTLCPDLGGGGIQADPGFLASVMGR